jgi:hypothetical protein
VLPRRKKDFLREKSKKQIFPFRSLFFFWLPRANWKSPSRPPPGEATSDPSSCFRRRKEEKKERRKEDKRN